MGAKSVSLASLVGRRSAGGGSGEVQIEETEYESEKEVNASLVPAARYLLLDAIFKKSLRPEVTFDRFRTVVAVRLLRL